MKLKIIVVELEIPTRVKLWSLRIGISVAALATASAVAYGSVPKTWIARDTLVASDLNNNFASLDLRVTALETGSAGLQSSLAALQANAITTIMNDTLNLTDSAAADWQPFAVTCVQQIVANAAQCTANACVSIPDACAIGAERKCVEGNHFRYGFFNGETGAVNAYSIICLK